MNRILILLVVLATLFAYAFEQRVINFATAGDNTDIDSIATIYTKETNIKNKDDVYLTTYITGAAGYSNYTVQANVNSVWLDIITDSLGVGASGGFETIMLRNRDSIGNFPYESFRVKHVTNDPSGTFTLTNILTSK